MSKTIYFFLFSFVFCFCQTLNSQQLQINEALSSNTIHLDDDGESSDWIEIYNPTNSDVSLLGWAITDKEDNLKWTFDATNISADGYLQIWASGKDRNARNYRTLINQGDQWQYIIPTQPVNQSWINTVYDDSNWFSGTAGFGYSDGDDETLIPSGTRSIYMRKQFIIEDITEVEQMILDIDYDDGFVAYLNGKEVARANMAEERPKFNDFSITDREARIYSGGKPDRFELDISCLQNGQNVLAIQAHNISTFSSDFSLIPFLSAAYTNSTSVGIIPPSILGFGENFSHTNFKISDGETLFLYNPDGEEVSKLLIENAPVDVSIGRRPSDQSVVWYQDPSPGKINEEIGFEGYLDSNIEFSQEGGLLNDGFQLTLSSPSTEDIILYTLDATEPNTSSNVYSSPISVSKNTVVRARLFKDGFIPSMTQTETYILEKDHEMPVISLVTEPDNFFSDETGIYVLGDGFFPIFPYEGSNIWEDWERPIHVSLFEKDGTSLKFDAGTKIFGGWSRALDQRSLSIFARGEYGTSEIDYPLFPNQPYTQYQAFILRNSGNDFLSSNMRDITLTSLMDGSGIETQSYRSVATYINGEYWGFFNMREKMNEHYLASRHNVDPETIDILGPSDEIIQGSDIDYKNMLSFLESNSLTSEDNYQWIVDQVDIDNFIMYHIAQIYFDNTDWPGNNNKQWRPKGGKWRWLLYDTDFGFGLWNATSYTNNTLDFALEANGPFWPNPPASTLLFRRLVENISFRNKFINQFADEMNSRFLPEAVAVHIDEVAESLASEIYNHYSRWSGSAYVHNEKVDEMITFGNFRPARMKSHIKSQFGLPDHHQLTLQVNNPIHGFIKVNSLTILDPIWEGDYFESVPISVTALPKEGYEFSHWVGAGSSTNPTLILDLNSDVSFTAIFTPSDDEPTAIINEINYKSSEENDSGDWIELHNPNNSPIDLEGWVITDDDLENGLMLPENSLLQGGHFLVLTKEKVKFENIHNDVDFIIDNLNFGLSSSGETIKLYDPEGVLRDSVAYKSTSPWPEMANGQDYTLELKSPTLDNSQAENWGNIHELGSPGYTNEKVTQSEEPYIEIDINRYPNPFRDKVRVDLSLRNTMHVSAKLYTRDAKLVKVIHDGQINKGSTFISDDLGHLSNGIYILKVDIEGNQQTFQWVKI